MSGANPGEPDSPDTAIPADVTDLATRVFDMARTGEATTLAAYVDAGVPVDLTNEAGDTLLMLAAYHGHPETVTALIHRGADVGRANDRGQTPLAGAVFKGEDDVVRALVDAGADPRAGHPSALDAARMFGRDDYLDLLGRSDTSGPVG
ncbi:ankyrin repeat domain-containing protein [Rhodococcus kroppenstedtii]|nr:ankyrin repeat domain-containing protein [Rhodococcus kroppenstedtii]